MTQYSLYLVNAAGVKVFFISLVANPVLYSLSLTITPVPTALPTGWTNPAGLALTGKTPQLRIMPQMVALTGFPAGFYPAAPQTSIYQANSGIPQITGVTALNITSNIVTSSGFSLYPNVLASFTVPSDQMPGSLIQVQPSNLDWCGVQKATTFTEIEVAIVDQLMKPIVIRDPAGFVCIINVRKVAQ